MKTRIDLHSELKNILNSNNVYYQPPENFKMEYPCIRYMRDRHRVYSANDKKYINKKRYQIILIDRNPDTPYHDKIMEMEYSNLDRHYVHGNLYHDVYSIYY